MYWKTENKLNTKKYTKFHYYISLLYAYTAFHSSKQNLIPGLAQHFL